MAVRETLELDIGPAEAAVQRLAGGLEQSLRNAISSALGGTYTAEVKGDAKDVETAVSQAVNDAEDEKSVGGDADDVESAVSDAVDDATDEKQVTGDASDVESAVSDAVDDATDEKQVDGDATGVTTAIDDAVASAEDTILIGADTTQLEQQLAGARDGIDSAAGGVGGLNDNLGQTAVLGAALGPRLGGGLAKVATPAGAAALGVAAIGGAVIDTTSSFVKFESQLSEVRTLLGALSDAEIRELEDAVLALSSKLGIATDDAIPALYQAISAGVPPDNVFGFLETAGTVAIGGVTNLETAVDGLTTVVNAYGMEQDQVSKVADVFFVGMRGGKTTIEELSRSMFQVVPIAANLGVSFEEVTAGLAAITTTGVPTRQAANMLKRMFTELGDSTTQVGGHFEAVAGVAFRQFIEQGGSVEEAMALLDQRAADLGVSVDQLFSSQVAAQGALILTGEAQSTFSELTAQAMAANGEAADAAAKVNESLARQVEFLRVRFDNLKTTLGRELAPAFAAVVSIIGDVMAGVEGLFRIVGSLSDGLGKLGVSSAFVTDALKTLLSGALNMIPGLGPVVSFLGVVGQATSDTADETDAASEAADKYAELMEGLGDELDSTADAQDRFSASAQIAESRMMDFVNAAAANVPRIAEAFGELSAEKGTDQILADLDAAFVATAEWTDQMGEQIAAGNQNIVGLMAELGPEKSRILLESYGGELSDLEAHLERLAWAEMSARVAAREMAVRQYLEMRGIVGGLQDDIVEEVRARLVLEDPTAESLDAAIGVIADGRGAPTAAGRLAGRTSDQWAIGMNLRNPTDQQLAAVNRAIALSDTPGVTASMARKAVEEYNQQLPGMARFTGEQMESLVRLITGSGVQEAGAEAGSGAAAGFVDGVAPVEGAGRDAAREAEQAIRREVPAFYSTGGRLAEQFASGIRLRVNTVRRAGADTGRSAVTGLRGAAPATEFFVVGGLTADGFARGIRSRAQASADEAARMVREAARRAREEAQTGSPSRLFASIGDDIGAGLALGMERQTSAVADAAREMLAAAEQASDPSFVSAGTTLREVSISVPVTVTGGVTADEGREFGEQVAGEVGRQLASTLRLEGLVA